MDASVKVAGLATCRICQLDTQHISARSAHLVHRTVFCRLLHQYCSRCQVLLIEAKPPMQKKMVDTLLYVHHAWTKAGL